MKFKTGLYNKPSNRKNVMSHRPKSNIKYTTENLITTKPHDLTSPDMATQSDVALTDSQGISYSSKKRFRKAYDMYTGGKTIDYRTNEPSVASKDTKTNISRNRHNKGASKTSDKARLYFNKKTRYRVRLI